MLFLGLRELSKWIRILCFLHIQWLASVLEVNLSPGIPSLCSGIPDQVVMKWSGHSDYKAMKPYIDIAEKVKAEQMAIFKNGLKG